MQEILESYLVKTGQKELGLKELIAFTKEELWIKKINVAGIELIVVKMPEHVIKKQSIRHKILFRFYKSILKKKAKGMQFVTELPLSVRSASLLQFLKAECRFRRNTHVLVAEEGKLAFDEILLPYCDKLNFLQIYTKNKEREEEFNYFLEELYEENGLSAGVTWSINSIETADVILDMTEGDLLEDMLKGNKIGQGCLYFDCFGSREKERYLRRKRGDITYISPMIYLDRALRDTV